MRSGRRRFAVTHCHSLQSSNRASPMDALIRAAVERVTGEPADGFDWSESLTTPAELAALLEPSDRSEDEAASRIDLLFVTDHVNETTTAFHPDFVALAAAEPRVALGAEIQTVAEQPAGSGCWVSAPEVLVYGTPDRVAAGSGWRFGLDEPLLVELQAECRPPGAPRAEVHRLLASCRRRGLAHALAHPLDGHRCDLATTLRVLDDCRFVEVVNGGFSGESTRRLSRYVALRNERTPIGDGGDGSAPELAVPWGGSDAHLGDYARVRMAWDPPAGGGGVADFLRDLVATPTHELLDDRVFSIVGRGNRLDRCLGEVLRLVARNARRNRDTFRGTRRLARLAVLGPALAVQRVLELRRDQARLGAALDRALDTAAALAQEPSSGEAQLLSADVGAAPAVPQ